MFYFYLKKRDSRIFQETINLIHCSQISSTNSSEAITETAKFCMGDTTLTCLFPPHTAQLLVLPCAFGQSPENENR